jgi:hypothetical protein
MNGPPIIDGRDESAVLVDLLSARPGFTPDWSPRPGGSGQGLLEVLARFCELVINGLRQAPDKGFLAFLDALGVGLLPPQAARAPLVVQLAPAAPTDVHFPSGSGVAVAAPPPPPSSFQAAGGPAAPPDPIVFSTEESISVCRAGLAAAVSWVPEFDQYADHSGTLGAGFSAFAGLQPVPHHLYLGHDSLLALPDIADVHLQVLPTSPGAQPGPDLAWEYLAPDGWYAFEPVDDHTQCLMRTGEIRLRKTCGPPAQPGAVNGVQSYWLRARTQAALLPEADAPRPLPELSTIRISVSHGTSGLPLDVAYGDGLKLDTSKDFWPFGTQPGLSSTLLIACDEAFQQKGATMGITFAMSKGIPAEASADLVLEWECSTSAGWLSLGPQFQLRDHSANLTQSIAAIPGMPPDPTITFVRPAGWEQSTLNGESHYWLRVRITSGGYGGPPTYSIQNGAVVADNVPAPPMLAGMTVSYEFDGPTFVPDHCLALNGFGFDDFTAACRWGGQRFQPFSLLPAQLPALHLGFDRPLPVDLVSILAAVPDDPIGDTADPVALSWEYFAPTGWAELDALDETSGFVRSGLIKFVGPPDLQASAGPKTPLFWIRARTRAAGMPAPLPLMRLFLNGVWATQQRFAAGEVVGSSDGSSRQAFLIQHPPVLGGERVEVQEWHGSGREWETLFQDLPTASVRYEKDARGEVIALWITWEERPNLYLSGAQDRHYTLERITGLLSFGDGLSGMVPTPGGPISMSYAYGGGPSGNVAAGTISRLFTAVPFVQAAANPLPAGGGAMPEGVNAVRRRGPQHLRSRDRAMSVSDYEWLAREASPEVAIARCLPETGPNGPGSPGWVTLVLVPFGDQPQPTPSPELRNRVRDHLRARMPAAALARVIPPAYRPIGVACEVVPVDPGQSSQVEERIRAALDQYLHPVRGGPDGNGWEFGEAVHASQVAARIEVTPGVAHLVALELVSGEAVFGEEVPVPAGWLPSAASHTISLRLRN